MPSSRPNGSSETASHDPRSPTSQSYYVCWQLIVTILVVVDFSWVRVGRKNYKQATRQNDHLSANFICFDEPGGLRGTIMVTAKKHDVIKVIVVEIYCDLVKRLMKITRIKFANGISLAKLLNGRVVCYEILEEWDLKSSSFGDFTERPMTSTAALQESCFIRHWDLN